AIDTYTGSCIPAKAVWRLPSLYIKCNSSISHTHTSLRLNIIGNRKWLCQGNSFCNIATGSSTHINHCYGIGTTWQVFLSEIRTGINTRTIPENAVSTTSTCRIYYLNTVFVITVCISNYKVKAQFIKLIYNKLNRI